MKGKYHFVSPQLHYGRISLMVIIDLHKIQLNYVNFTIILLCFSQFDKNVLNIKYQCSNDCFCIIQ